VSSPPGSAGPVPPRSAADAAGSTWVGDYRVRRRLGAGGMGLVYLAEAADGGLVAVKVIRPEYAEDPLYRSRFRREAEAAARVRDSGVARVLACSMGDTTAGDLAYLVTEYVPGPSLRDRVAAAGPLRGAELDAFAAALARALAAVHAAGVVHRDLKPANVILSPAGPRLVDFGIARSEDSTTRYTTTGEIVGSMGWIAPEVLRQLPARPAADVFAWGAVVTFAGTGRRPFGDGPEIAVAHRILAGPPPDLTGLPAHLRPLVAEALAADPQRRPRAAAVAARLASLGGSAPAWPQPTSAVPQLDPTRRAPAPDPGRRGRLGPRVVLTSAGGVLAVTALLVAPAGHSRTPSGGAAPTAGAAPPAKGSAAGSTPARTSRSPRPAASTAGAQRGPGVLVAAVVPAVQDGDVVFRITDLRCGLARVGQGAGAQDEPDGVRACTGLVTVRNVGGVPHLLLPQTLHGSDGRGYGSNGFLTPRLGRRPLELHVLRPREALRSALVWELPAGVRPVDVEVHGDVLSLGTRRSLA
jgi:eukaryotic-like serine/threonine-protein kinase